MNQHLPELVPLHNGTPRRGDLVAKRSGSLAEVWRVHKVEGETAVLIRPRQAGERLTVPLAALLVVKQFGEPIFPTLTPVDAVQNGPEDAPWHTLIEADNYHACNSWNTSMQAVWTVFILIRLTIPERATDRSRLMKLTFEGKRKNMPLSKRVKLEGRGPVGKMAVVGMKDRQTNWVVAKVVQDTKTETLKGFIDDHRADEETPVYTDDATAYSGPSQSRVGQALGDGVCERSHPHQRALSPSGAC